MLTDVAQKGVLGAYLLITPTFFLSTWSIGGGLFWQTKKRGVLGTGQVKKGGVLGTGQVKKNGGGGLRHGSGKKTGVFTAAHTCTGHICEWTYILRIAH